jgi:amino-acid N-acetyltransferase
MYGRVLMGNGQEVGCRVTVHSDGQLLVVRQAARADVGAITALIKTHAARGNLLPRSRKNIEDTLPNWLVAVHAGAAAGQILGCVNLFPYGPGLYEVRSLAVDDGARGEGVGTRLVEALEQVASQRGGQTLFALTRAVPFFERLGFMVTDRYRFPEKVWNACRHCPLIDDCDEIAVEKVIGDWEAGSGDS